MWRCRQAAAGTRYAPREHHRDRLAPEAVVSRTKTGHRLRAPGSRGPGHRPQAPGFVARTAATVRLLADRTSAKEGVAGLQAQLALLLAETLLETRRPSLPLNRQHRHLRDRSPQRRRASWGGPVRGPRNELKEKGDSDVRSSSRGS